MRELCTLQFGHYANFVGSHFWNIQDELLAHISQQDIPEIDPRILFREGQTPKGRPTFTPRLILVDSKGSLGALNPLGSAYSRDQHDSNVNLWHGSVDTITSDPIPKNLFLKQLDESENSEQTENMETEELNQKNQNQNEDKNEEAKAKTDEQEEDEEDMTTKIVKDLEKNVNVWSDYLKPDFHRKTIHQLSNVVHQDTEFDLYSNGIDILAKPYESEDIIDDVRFFVEECDNIQGFQTFVDADTGYSAVASDIMTQLYDDFRLPFITYALFNRSNDNVKKNVIHKRTFNDAMSLYSLSEISRVYVPIYTNLFSDDMFPYLSLDKNKPFHTSAVIASAIDTATLCTRMASGTSRATLLDIAGTLNVMPSIRVASLSSALPLGIQENGALADFFEKKGPFHKSHKLASYLTPFEVDVENPKGPFGYISSLRGVSQYNIYKSEQSARNHSFSNCTNIFDLMNQYYEQIPAYSEYQYTANQSLPIPIPFPDIFTEDLTEQGLVKETADGKKENVISSPMISQLQTHEGLEPFLKNTFDSFKKLNVKSPQFKMHPDEQEATAEYLGHLADDYAHT